MVFKITLSKNKITLIEFSFVFEDLRKAEGKYFTLWGLKIYPLNVAVNP